MRLSEAIRLGSMLAPQGFIWGASEEERGKGLCALAAASAAMGKQGSSWAHRLFRVLEVCGDLGFEHSCPACGQRNLPVEAIIGIHLNDKHRWTRERIADWVETVEVKHERDHTAHRLDQLEAVLVTKA